VSSPKKRNSLKQSAANGPSVVAITAGAERWFRVVADYTVDWESWHGPDGRLLWVNPAVERMTGYSVAECLAMPDYPLPIVVAEDRPNIANAFGRARDQMSGENLDFRITSYNDQVRWMSLCWQPMYAAEGEYLGYRTSVRDITEQRALRDQLRLHAEHLEQLVQERTEQLWQLELRQRKMEKLVALGQLAAGVAHEINNPLAGMRNAFELIKSSLSPDNEHFELLGLVDKEIERISGITHQMYQLYKRAPQQPGEFGITHSIEEVISILTSTAGQRQIRLSFESPGDPLRVKLVEGEVKQILYNLISNAIQASPIGEYVAIRIRQTAREIVVRIEDQGPGIPEEILPRIFDPFFSTKQADKQAGMGLGLSVSRSLIEAMGGRIKVSSTPGKGSVFSAIFPRIAIAHAETIDE
jgi:two-component system sporulation sensor kinase C